MSKRRVHLFVGVMIICLVLAGCSSGCTISESTKLVILEFTNYSEDMQKYVLFKEVDNEIILNYSNFSLGEGEMVMEMIPENSSTFIFQKKLNPNDASEGTVVVTGLIPGNNYILRIYAVDASEGSIKITW